ncbi:chaperone protein dnaJ 72-like [Rutidosis leptorrhynchoides]|uniref:chaperone protein dnaJ 72-like n=1 Tax=Rutidosis leptorrhynchoides TaxID=125765 RepID=UPI003A992820
MDHHYKVLGLTRNANEEEIKAAFRRLAVQYHPDKHSQSPPSVRDAATLRFKQITDAHDTLVRRRGDFDIRRSSAPASTYSSAHQHYYSHSSYGNRNFQGKAEFGGGGLSSKMEIVFRFFTTRDFLRSLAFAGVVVGCAVLIERSKDALWKTRNSGKSFEEALESIEKAKASKD